MSLPTHQTTYRITSYAGPQDIKPFTEPLDAELGKTEILVKIKAVSLNYRDVEMSEGGYPIPLKHRVIPCSDASGEVVKIGTHVSDLEIGDRIISNFAPTNFYGPLRDPNSAHSAGIDGVLTQYKVFESNQVNKLPKDTHLSHEEAAALVCTGVTAWNSLYGSGNPFIAGQSVLVLGTGGVSITALVLAKAAGAVTIVTSSSDEKLKYVQEKYGADHVINYNTFPDWDKKVLDVTGGKGADFIMEVGGSSTIEKSISSVAIGGQIAIIGYLNQDTQMPNIIIPVLLKSVFIRGIQIGSKQLAEQLLRFVHAKKLRMPIEGVFGFTEEEVHKAYAIVKSQSQVGKTVIKVVE